MFSKPLAVALLAVGCVTAAAGGAYVAVRQNAEPAAPTMGPAAAVPEAPAVRPVAETEAIVAPVEAAATAIEAPKPRAAAPAPRPATTRPARERAERTTPRRPSSPASEHRAASSGRAAETAASAKVEPPPAAPAVDRSDRPGLRTDRDDLVFARPRPQWLGARSVDGCIHQAAETI